MREKPRLRNEKAMKTKAKTKQNAGEMQTEYGESFFLGAVRGKYAARYRQGTNIVLLDADVAQVFHDAASVNETLRSLIGIARHVPAR